MKLAFSKGKTDTGKVKILVETGRMHGHGSMYKNNEANFDMAEYFLKQEIIRRP